MVGRCVSVSYTVAQVEGPTRECILYCTYVIKIQLKRKSMGRPSCQCIKYCSAGGGIREVVYHILYVRNKDSAAA